MGVKNFRERPAEQSQTNLILKRGDIKGGRFSEVPENYWGKKVSKKIGFLAFLDVCSFLIAELVKHCI